MRLRPLARRSGAGRLDHPGVDVLLRVEVAGPGGEADPGRVRADARGQVDRGLQGQLLLRAGPQRLDVDPQVVVRRVVVDPGPERAPVERDRRLADGRVHVRVAVQHDGQVVAARVGRVLERVELDRDAVLDAAVAEAAAPAAERPRAVVLHQEGDAVGAGLGVVQVDLELRLERLVQVQLGLGPGRAGLPEAARGQPEDALVNAAGRGDDVGRAVAVEHRRGPGEGREVDQRLVAGRVRAGGRRARGYREGEGGDQAAPG